MIGFDAVADGDEDLEAEALDVVSLPVEGSCCKICNNCLPLQLPSSKTLWMCLEMTDSSRWKSSAICRRAGGAPTRRAGARRGLRSLGASWRTAERMQLPELLGPAGRRREAHAVRARERAHRRHLVLRADVRVRVPAADGLLLGVLGQERLVEALRLLGPAPAAHGRISGDGSVAASSADRDFGT